MTEEECKNKVKELSNVFTDSEQRFINFVLEEGIIRWRDRLSIIKKFVKTIEERQCIQ